MQPLLPRGKYLNGVPVGPFKFQGVATLNQLEDYGMSRPSMTSRLTKGELAENPRLIHVKELRDQVQRRFDKRRTERAEVYARYIERVECEGMEGGTPAITLYLPGGPAVVDATGLLVPFNATMIPVDGETQAEARNILRDRRPETGDNPLAITVYHSTTPEHARQILVDYNKHAHPMSETQCIGLDSTSPLAAAVREAARLARIDPLRIGRHRPTPGRGEAVTNMQLSYGAVGHAMGQEALRRDARSWFEALSDTSAGPVINGATAPALARIAVSAMAGERGIKAKPLVWQAAGIKVAGGADPATFNWAAANDAVRATRGKFVDRMARVAAAL